MEAERGQAVAEVEVDRRREGLQHRQLVGGELCLPELADLEEPLADLVLGRRDALAEPRLPVALHDGTVERQDPRERLGRLRADGEVAEADEAVEVLMLELGEDGVERQQVAVRVRDTPIRFTSRAPGRGSQRR